MPNENGAVREAHVTEHLN